MITGRDAGFLRNGLSQVAGLRSAAALMLGTSLLSAIQPVDVAEDSPLFVNLSRPVLALGAVLSR